MGEWEGAALLKAAVAGVVKGRVCYAAANTPAEPADTIQCFKMAPVGPAVNDGYVCVDRKPP